MSDTVTKPSVEMLNVMFNAKVGDDVYKQDPTVNELEETLADLFGMEAALFFPSGTMANQTAIKLHTQPGEQVICDKYSHIYHYEGGGASFNSGVSCCLVDGNRGMITADLVKNGINDPEFYHAPLTSLVSIENTKQFGELFDTISVCLSKGLGAPVGSVLLGSKADMHRALRIRKIFGGNMRQSGYLAAAGLFALQNNISRLEIDHRRAKELGSLLEKMPWVANVEPVETNILIFGLQSFVDEKIFMEKLKQKGIAISSMGHGKLRIVTHLDYKEVMHEYVMEVFSKLSF